MLESVSLWDNEQFKGVSVVIVENINTPPFTSPPPQMSEAQRASHACQYGWSREQRTPSCLLLHYTLRTCVMSIMYPSQKLSLTLTNVCFHITLLLLVCEGLSTKC